MDLCIEMHTGWANPADNNDPLYEWNYNTYNTSLNINSPLDFLNDPNGRIIYKRKLRYIMSRWGYSSSIGIVELLSEPDGWWNYSNSNSAITDLYNWHAFMIDYLKNELGYTNHLYSTGMATRSGSTYALNSIDISSTHMYARAKKLNHERYNHMNENNILNSNNGLLVDYDKPSIFGEMGIMGGNVDPNLLEGCNDIAFHNALWSTSFMGCLGPGLNWWQTGNNSYRSQNFPALNAFFNNINFETDAFTYPQKWRETTIPFDDYNLEVFAVRNFNKEKIMGWAHSASNYWGNVSDNCTINGNMPNLPPDDDNTSNPIPSIDQFKLDNLKLLTKYNIDWYYTRNIGPLGAPFHSLNKWSNIFGTLKTTLPSINEYDYAFKAYKTEIHSQFDSPPEIDTLLCFEDSIQVDGNSNNDSSIISYSWNFGNGTISSLPNPIVQYSSPGTYNVILIRTDTSGISDTLTQTIYVPDCQTLFKNQNLQLMDNNFVIVYPNPNNGMFDVTFGNNIEGDKHIQLINNNGVVIFSTHSNESILGINLLSESNGLYFLKIVFDNGQTTIKKIIKQ